MKAIPRSDVPGAWVVVSGPRTYNVYTGPDPSLPRRSCAAAIYTDTQRCKHVRFVEAL